MVINMVDEEDVSPRGTMVVERISSEPDVYEIVVEAMTFSVPANEVQLQLNGVVPLGTLDMYPNSTPYTDRYFSYHTGQNDLVNVGTGTVIHLETSDELHGEIIEVVLIRTNGAVVSSLSFFEPGAVDQRPSLDLSDASYDDGTAAGYPLAFASDDNDYVFLPQSTIGTVTTQFNVSCQLKLNKPPSEQESWASIININRDHGYRLQLSGSSNDNKWFEFGADGYWVRSDGRGGGSEVTVQEGVTYEVWGVLDFEKRQVSVWVNSNEGGPMVMSGSRTYDSDSLPIIGSGDWYLGAWGGQSPSRGYLDGEVYWIDVQTA